MPFKVTPKEFQELLPFICDKKTSVDPNGWKPENPLWGHCAIVAILAKELFGGEILRASLEKTEFTSMRSHYWNRIRNGQEIDFTAAQFGNCYPSGLEPEVRDSGKLLDNADTAKRYYALVYRFNLYNRELT